MARLRAGDRCCDAIERRDRRHPSILRCMPLQVLLTNDRGCLARDRLISRERGRDTRLGRQ